MMRRFGKRTCLLFLLWFFQGVLVGFGAILPGVSGGALCAAFGMYFPIISVISHPKDNIRKFGFMLFWFLFGAAVGFIGLSGFAGWLMELSSELVTCGFLGLILGTLPALYMEAGASGRSAASMVSCLLGFTTMLLILLFLRGHTSFFVEPGFIGYLFCGIVWGLSFMIPGLSSSSLLLFFGLYQSMLSGIAALDPAVLLPMAIGTADCIFSLSNGIHTLYLRHYSVVSHVIVGVVAATALMIFPTSLLRSTALATGLVCIAAGAAFSGILTSICAKIKK